MQMTISGHHLDVTDPIREYVTSKLSKLERHYDHINSTAVILSVEKLSQKAEATIHVSEANYSLTLSMKIFMQPLTLSVIN